MDFHQTYTTGARWGKDGYVNFSDQRSRWQHAL